MILFLRNAVSDGRINVKALLSFALFLSCVLSAQSNIDFSVLDTKNEKLIERFRRKHEIPGLSVSISYKNQLVYSKGFGYADVQNQKAVSPSATKFRTGSISKTMTAVALASLQEQNKVKLNESIYKYLDSLSVKDFDITIEQVLSHRAGLVRDYEKKSWCGDVTLHRNNFYQSFQQTEFISKPGSNFSYSNYGYMLLGVLIEKLTGKSLIQSKKELVLDRVGLNHTVPDDGNFDAETSVFYHRYQNQLKIVPCVDNRFNYGPGGYLSTTEDLVRLGNSYLYADRLLSKETFKQLLEPRNDEKTYGLGFIIGKDYYKNFFYGHGGAYWGGMGDLRIYPKERLVISVLINIKDNSINFGSLLDEIIFQYIDHIKKAE